MRSQLLLVDICNLLHCVSEILPSICESGESYVGLNINNQSKIIRDIHAKCQELFCCLLLRGIPLGSLYKVIINTIYIYIYKDAAFFYRIKVTRTIFQFFYT